MLHAGEALRRGVAHPLGGAVGGDEARVGGLEIEQLPVELVVNRILELGGIEHVIGMGGPGEQPPQFHGPGLLGGWGRTRRSHGLRRPPLC